MNMSNKRRRKRKKKAKKLLNKVPRNKEVIDMLRNTKPGPMKDKKKEEERKKCRGKVEQ